VACFCVHMGVDEGLGVVGGKAMSDSSSRVSEGTESSVKTPEWDRSIPACRK
jgi:hypothetical protein